MKIRIWILCAAAVLMAVFFGCSSNLSEGTASVAVQVNMKQPAVPITSVALVVTGPDMAPIAQEYAASVEGITVEVPAGAARAFSLLVNTAWAVFRGDATVYLPPGVSTTVTLDMGLYATELIFPDYNDFGNGRLIQIDDISGAGWQVLTGNALSGTGISDPNFRPYDVDFDDRGRIFIANNYGAAGTGANAVIRINDISGAGVVKFAELEVDYGVNSLAVDRKRKLVYFSTTDSFLTPSPLHRSDLDGGNMTTLITTVGVEPIGVITGMAVDENGVLYLSGRTAVGGPFRIFRYDPVSQSVLATYAGADLNDPWDVLYKSPYLYVANNNGADGSKIIRLNADLMSPVGFGTRAGDTGDPDTSPGMFYGPRRFVAILNRKITIIDDHNFQNLDKLVSMDDITGAGWQTLPVSGDGQSLFTFYYTC